VAQTRIPRPAVPATTRSVEAGRRRGGRDEGRLTRSTRRPSSVRLVRRSVQRGPRRGLPSRRARPKGAASRPRRRPAGPGSTRAGTSTPPSSPTSTTPMTIAQGGDLRPRCCRVISLRQRGRRDQDRERLRLRPRRRGSTPPMSSTATRIAKKIRTGTYGIKLVRVRHGFAVRRLQVLGHRP